MIIYGRNAIKEAILSEHTFNKLFVDKNLRDKTSEEIITLAKENNVKINFVERKILDQKFKGKEKISHQGFVAEVVDFEYCEVEDILNLAQNKNQPPFIIILDGVEDPHNLGAIIRTAECAGVHGIIIPEHRACAVNDTVLKTSAGAANLVKIARVTNLNLCIEKLKEKGVWVYAMEADGQDLWKSNLTGSIAIVMGSEGSGVSKLTKQKCDGIISIPMFGKINSLNVSVATAITTYEILKQRSK